MNGKLYHSIGLEPNVFAFVPDYCISNGKLDKDMYLKDGWAHLNNMQQAIPRGSHVWPDTTRPITKESLLSKEFLSRLNLP